MSTAVPAARLGRTSRPPTAASAPSADVGRARTLSRVLDHFLLDPLLGLIAPGVGDLAGSLLGLYTVAIAVRRRMSPIVIARMLLNLAVDSAIGAIPLAGDLFDLGFRANARNVALLEAREGTGGRATARDWLAVVGAALAFLAAIGLAIYAMIAIARAVF